MAKEVRWTKEAEEGFAKVVSYLQDKWTDKEVSNFITATFKTISYITENPLFFVLQKSIIFVKHWLQSITFLSIRLSLSTSI